MQALLSRIEKLEQDAARVQASRTVYGIAWLDEHGNVEAMWGPGTIDGYVNPPPAEEDENELANNPRPDSHASNGGLPLASADGPADPSAKFARKEPV